MGLKRASDLKSLRPTGRQTVDASPAASELKLTTTVTGGVAITGAGGFTTTVTGAVGLMTRILRLKPARPSALH